MVAAAALLMLTALAIRLVMSWRGDHDARCSGGDGDDDVAQMMWVLLLTVIMAMVAMCICSASPG